MNESSDPYIYNYPEDYSSYLQHDAIPDLEQNLPDGENMEEYEVYYDYTTEQVAQTTSEPVYTTKEEVSKLQWVLQTREFSLI